MPPHSRTRHHFRRIGGVAAILWLLGGADRVLPAKDPSPECWQSLSPQRVEVPLWGPGRTAAGRDIAIESQHLKLPPLPLALTDAETEAYRDLREKSSEANLIRAAAFASGLADPADIKRFAARVLSLATRMEHLAKVPDPLLRANTLLIILHQNLMQTYTAQQPYPASVFDTGLFNCVASTILFNIFAAHVGLQTQAVGEPDHVFSVVSAGGQLYGVGTTVINGFATLLDPKLTGLVTSNAALVGMAFEDRLAFNHDDRPSNLEDSGEAALGVEVALWRRIAALTPGDGRVRRNLAGALHNLSAWLHHHGRPEEAFALAREALPVSVETEQQKAVRLDVAIAAGDWMQSLLKKGDVARAGAVLEQARETLGCVLEAPECQPLSHEASAVLFEASDSLKEGRSEVFAQLVAIMATKLPSDQPEVLTTMALGAAHSLWREKGRVCADGFVQAVTHPALCGGQPRLLCEQLTRWAALRWLAFSPAKAVGWLGAER